MFFVSPLLRCGRGPIKTHATRSFIAPRQIGIYIRQTYTKSTPSSQSSSRWRTLAHHLVSYVVIGLSVYGCMEIRDWVILYPMVPAHIKKDLKLEDTKNSKSKDTSYRYEYLPDGYIRLVDVKPGKYDDPIELELNSIRFRPPGISFWNPVASVPEYVALSYQWGEHEEKDLLPVTLNGQPFHITPNLHSALLVLRHNSNSPSFWIDAICLDQDDNLEKDRQLGIMHQIYKNATDVLIWLGDDDQSVDIRAAIGIISHFSEKIQQLFSPNSLDPTEVVKSEWHTGPEYSSGWKAIQNILSRPYFTRSWIIQEMLLSSSRTILVGHHDVTNILGLVELLNNYPEIEGLIPVEHLNEPDVIPRIYELTRAMMEYRAGSKRVYKLPGINLFYYEVKWHGLSLGRVLVSFRGKKSTMPMDQVYSVLGTTVEMNPQYMFFRWLHPSSTGLTQPLPEFNHKQPLEKLCANTTRYILAQDGDLGILRMVNTHERPTNKIDWPSWVPDFSSPLPGPGEPKSSEWKLERTTFPKEMNRFCIDGDRLVVYGHVLSEIQGQIRVVKSDEKLYEADEQQGRSEYGWGERENLRMRQKYGYGFLPLEIWRDSEGREVQVGAGVRRGDLVVVVGGGRDPLILRRSRDGGGFVIGAGNEGRVYELLGTANISGIDKWSWRKFLKDIEWDVKEMVIK